MDHVLALTFDAPSIDDDLCRTLNAHEIVFEEDWPDVW